MNTLHGGNINSSFVSKMIIDFSRRYNQTPDIKRAINMSITNTGHGSILLGTSSRLDNGNINIRMLVGAHFARHGKLKIGVFGGGCEGNEITIDTVIRETIEEIFNFKAEQLMIDGIRDFLNTNTDCYYIYQFSETTTAYSYIFDVSILGNFISIINDIYRPQNVAFFIPTNTDFTNINSYLHDNIAFSDESSFSGRGQVVGTGNTINLVEFMRERYLSRDMFSTFKRLSIKRASGLDEIKYLSFVSLSKLVASVPSGSYDLFNFVKNKRERLEMQHFLTELLNKDIIRVILSYQ